MQNQKKPIQQKKPMQNFTAEKWADKIALFIDNFGFLSGFFWHWTIALPSPTSHLAMLHSKIILSDPNRRVKVVLIGFSLFWSRCRTWGTIYLTYLILHEISCFLKAVLEDIDPAQTEVRAGSVFVTDTMHLWGVYLFTMFIPVHACTCVLCLLGCPDLTQCLNYGLPF